MLTVARGDPQPQALGESPEKKKDTIVHNYINLVY